MDPPVNLRNATTSCIAHGRSLFLRFVFIIGMDPPLAAQIIAFWLLLQGNGVANLLRRIDSFRGDQFLAAAVKGELVIQTLHGNVTGSPPNTLFSNQLVSGIIYCLNNVCKEVLKDLMHKVERERARRYWRREREVERERAEGGLPPLSTHLPRLYGNDWRQMSMAESSNSTRSVPDAAIQNIQGPITMRVGSQSSSSDNVVLPEDQDVWSWTPPQQGNSGGVNGYHEYYQAESSNSTRSMLNAAIQNTQGSIMMRDGIQSSSNIVLPEDLDVWSPQLQRNSGVNAVGLEPNVSDLAYELSRCAISPQYQFQRSFPQSFTMNMDPYFHSLHQFPIVPQHERTLFVTFSIGMPLTEEEVYDFFMRHFGDVESVTVEIPVEDRPPQFAHVTFGSLETMLCVLDGKVKVKFMSGGKHLWARKYEQKPPVK